jgi:hypothetical protein
MKVQCEPLPPNAVAAVALPRMAIGSLAFTAVDRSLMQRGVEIELVAPTITGLAHSRFRRAISVVTHLWLKGG